jgi:hypothetical protein
MSKSVYCRYILRKYNLSEQTKEFFGRKCSLAGLFKYKGKTAFSIGLLDSPLYSGNILSMYMYLNTAAILFQQTRLLKDLKIMALGCLELIMGEPKTNSSCLVKM